jgi:hypothetical protein
MAFQIKGKILQEHPNLNPQIATSEVFFNRPRHGLFLVQTETENTLDRGPTVAPWHEM